MRMAVDDRQTASPDGPVEVGDVWGAAGAVLERGRDAHLPVAPFGRHRDGGLGQALAIAPNVRSAASVLPSLAIPSKSFSAAFLAALSDGQLRPMLAPGGAATIVARGRAGASILVSSHLLHRVEEICTRVIIIDRGRLLEVGTSEELYARPESFFVATFLGAGVVRVLPVSVHVDALQRHVRG